MGGLVFPSVCPAALFFFIFSSPNRMSFFFFVLGFSLAFNNDLSPFSVVSVKGSRKLSLPTDLKTDLGTVGESQQF